MADWQRRFLEKLSSAQSTWVAQFDEQMNQTLAPVVKNLTEFLQNNGFQVSTPLREPGRQSYKFELAENAYLLMILRFVGIGEFEIRTESFVPGADPQLEKRSFRLADINDDWAQREFQAGLDRFVELLGTSEGAPTEKPRRREPEPALA